MGQTHGRVLPGKMSAMASETKNVNDSLPIPWDTVLHVLSFVPSRDLVVNCRRVNTGWKAAVDNCHVWITKMNRDGVAYPPVAEMTEYGLDWKKVATLRPFGRNLLKNWDGSGGFSSWSIMQNNGDRFQLQPASSPPGSEAVPIELNCKRVWATSYGACIKEQTVDLIASGCDAAWLDMVQPEIEVSEWVANRHDCATKYQLAVNLCNEQGATLTSPNATFVHNRHRGQWVENNWEKVSHIFKDYGPGLRHVYFSHTGRDGQFWAGHYGPKMAAPSVIVRPAKS